MKRMSDQSNYDDGSSDNKTSPPAEKIAKEDEEKSAGAKANKAAATSEDGDGKTSEPSTVFSSNGVENSKTTGAEICQSTSESNEDARNVTAGSSTSTLENEQITLTLAFGKDKFTMTESLDESVENFKEKVAELTNVPPTMQKLMFKGMLKDGQTLRDAKLTDGCKVMLIGSTPTQIAAANTAPKPEELRQAAAEAVSREPLCKQKQHAKVLEKGIPDDVMPGIKNARDGLPSQPIFGMINKMGNKVRLTFKLELDQVWLGTKERTDKIPMSQVKDIVSEPIEGHEEYHIIGLQLGPTEASRYWLYWVPAQYVAAIREAILG